MKKVFLTFGDGGEQFVAARNRIARETERVGIFDSVKVCDWSNCTPDALASPLRKYRRGCGYWVWKPDVIWQELSKLSAGDVLVWSDAGNVVHRTRRQWRLLLGRLVKSDIVCRRISACGFHWQRKELLESFSSLIDKNARIRMCFNFEAGQILFKKTKFTMQLVEEWRMFMLAHPECVCDVGMGESDVSQLPTFVENRHDQSVFSCLVYKYLSQPETRGKIVSLWEFHQGAWPFGNPALEVARNRCGSEWHLPLKARVARVPYRLLWRLQSFLERRGVVLCWAKYFR